MQLSIFKSSGTKIVAIAIFIFLLLFLIIPVIKVFFVAFQDVNSGNFTLVNFIDFFKTSLFIESFWNSFYVALSSVVVASIIALPLAYFTSRFSFGGTVFIQSLGIIPLIMPPFVGAVAIQLLFGTNGSINLLLSEYFSFTIPFMKGLNGVIFVESIHYFPFILINLSASLANIDRSMEESALSLGSSGTRLFRRIVLPLGMPGYIAGASLVFVKVFDDLGTPLLLNVNNMLAPQAYLRISSIGISDPMGYVISVILVLFSLFAMWVSFLAIRGKEYSTIQKGGGGLMKRELSSAEKLGVYAIILLIFMVVLSPHIALSLLSFGTIWSFAPLPDAYTLAHYQEVFLNSGNFIKNTLVYAGGAAIIDVILGASIAYIVWRTDLKGRKLLDYMAMSALAVPGVVLGIGYLRSFNGVDMPFTNVSFANFWFIIVIALAIRRLPYALRACVAAIQQVSISLEEASESLGAKKIYTIKRIVIPLIIGGILAGFVTSFATAAVELSTTLMLVARGSDAPISYSIYVYMQSAAGRGPGAALGILAVIIVALGTYLSNVIIRKTDKRISVS